MNREQVKQVTRVAVHLARTERSSYLRQDHLRRALCIHSEQQAERVGRLSLVKPRPRPRPLAISYLLP